MFIAKALAACMHAYFGRKLLVLPKQASKPASSISWGRDILIAHPSIHVCMVCSNVVLLACPQSCFTLWHCISSICYISFCNSVQATAAQHEPAHSMKAYIYAYILMQLMCFFHWTVYLALVWSGFAHS